MAEFSLKVRPLAFHPSFSKEHLNAGGKVILPQSILNRVMDISGNEIHSPIVFTLIKDGKDLISVGVEEFSSPVDYVYLPNFIMEQYWLPHESEVVLRYESVQKGTMVELEPHRTAFIDSDAKNKDYLESYISKHYPVLRKGSTILIKENGEEYYINIKDTAPGDIILTVDTDLRVEFAQPLDYVEPPPPAIVETMAMPTSHFIPFAGKGYRLGHRAN